jgi:hypothetical protein
MQPSRQQQQRRNSVRKTTCEIGILCFAEKIPKRISTTIHGTMFLHRRFSIDSKRKTKKYKLGFGVFVGRTCSSHESVCSLTTGAKNDRIFKFEKG